MRYPKLLILVFLCAPAPSGAADYPPADVAHLVARLNNQRLSASCTGSVAPAAAVLTAGMSAEGLKPGAVQAQLEKQLAALEELVGTHRGTLRRLELLRGVRGLDETNQKAPYVVLQRLEIELPLSAPLDDVLERLLLLGIDRFGSDMGLDWSGRAPRLVAVYRFDRLEEQLRAVHAGCRSQAFRSWCEEHSAELPVSVRPGCSDILEQLGGWFRDEALPLNGLRVVEADGRSRAQGVTWPSGTRWEEIRSGGPEPVELHGVFNTTFELRPR